MILPLVTKPTVPDSIFIPMILLQTGIVNGKLYTSCQLQFSAAKVENPNTEKENWIPTGQTQTIYLSDLLNLESDLEKLGDKVKALYGDILEIIAFVNETRKVL